MLHPTLAPSALNILLVWLGFLAGWTFGSVPLTLIGAPFGFLWVAFICGLCGIVLAVRAQDILVELLLSTPEYPVRKIATNRTRGLMALVTVSIFAATVWFIPTDDARPLWGVSLLSCLLVLSILRPFSTTGTAKWVPQKSPALSGVALLALVLWGLYIVILRHDADDAFYLNLPIGLANAPHGMLVWDTMYGAENWPLLGSNYRVEALQTLIAAFAQVSGLSVVIVAHLILPTIWCLAWAATLAVIGTALFGPKWWVFAVLAVLSSFVFAGSLQNWGVHGLARLFHGKAPLILIIIPLIYLLTHRADLTGTPLRRVLPLLAGLITIGVGLTANAIYIAPLALGLAVFAGWAFRDFRATRRLWTIAAATPAVVAGLWLLIFDTPASLPEGAMPSYSGLSLWSMFPEKLPLGLFALTLAAACCIPFVAPGARFITGCLLGTLIFVLNPLLGPVYSEYVTGGLNFRLWWAIPVPLLFALFVTAAVIRIRQVWLLPAVVVVLLALSFAPTGLLGMNGTKFTPSFTKRPSGMSEVIQDIKRRAEDRKVLANEEVAAWLPTIEDPPPLVYVRHLYFDQNIAVVAVAELGSRRVLADWVNMTGDVTPENVLEALKKQCPRLLVFPAEQEPAGFDVLRLPIGAELAGTVQNIKIFHIQPNCR